MNNISLRERILKAGSAEEMEKLLVEGRTYQFVSPITVRRWQRAIRFRLNELKSGSILGKMLEDAELTDALHNVQKLT